MECGGSLQLLQNPPPLPILNKINPVHATHPTSWRCILILSSNLRLSLLSGLFTSGFPWLPRDVTAALTFKHEKAFVWSHSNYQRHFVEPPLSHQINGRLVKKNFFSVYLSVLGYRCKQTFSPVLNLLSKHTEKHVLYATCMYVTTQ
jgi:hypothetical protein